MALVHVQWSLLSNKQLNISRTPLSRFFLLSLHSLRAPHGREYDQCGEQR